VALLEIIVKTYLDIVLETPSLLGITKSVMRQFNAAWMYLMVLGLTGIEATNYYRVTTPSSTGTYEDAKTACGADKLVDVSGSVETTYLQNYLKSEFPQGRVVWIGLTGDGWESGENYEIPDGLVFTAEKNCAELTINAQGITTWSSISCASATPTIVCETACANGDAGGKTLAGVCGCATSDLDTDGDLFADCQEDCDADETKQSPGSCGCGNPETDTDGDGTPDCAEECDEDPNKLLPLICGCGTAETDSDGDGTLDCKDECPVNADKILGGVCGCTSNDDGDTDNDGTANCIDGCPSDANKTVEGSCGCGNLETDTDGDGTADCVDDCQDDAAKIGPGVCGCGVADTDTDGDLTPDCNDDCPNDADKVSPGDCGCGAVDTDTDGDLTPDCNDDCPNDAAKTAEGQCGCGNLETDTDNDGSADCVDECPNDPAKSAVGQCGCGNAETDTDSDSTPDCTDNCDADPLKVEPGSCGCGIVDVDGDNDGIFHCVDANGISVDDVNGIAPDLCDDDANKTEPGDCGCGVVEADTDGDGFKDCQDTCNDDPNKQEPGVCGCNIPDTDNDGEGTPNCNDVCPEDASKNVAVDLVCACGTDESATHPLVDGVDVGLNGDDFDGDLYANCQDSCPRDPFRQDESICPCNTGIDFNLPSIIDQLAAVLVLETDSDGDGVKDCKDNCPNNANLIEESFCGCNDVDSDGDFHYQCAATRYYTYLLQLTIDFDPASLPLTVENLLAIETQIVQSTGFDAFTTNMVKISTNSGVSSARKLDETTANVRKLTEETLTIVFVSPTEGDLTDLVGVFNANIQEVANNIDAQVPLASVADNENDITVLAPIAGQTQEVLAPDDCVDDPLKFTPGFCGCGVVEDINDDDDDGSINCLDECPTDPLKVKLGVCGCNTEDVDTDDDGVMDCVDDCPADPLKSATGFCGCNNPETDVDNDAVPDCIDNCPTDPLKTETGFCGCGTSDADTDADGTVDCMDDCANDALKLVPGTCGCGVPEDDTDGDGTPDCNDECPNSDNKTVAGSCGCDAPETDSDSDGTPDCNDLCQLDPLKTAPGDCGCGIADVDEDLNGTPDCNDPIKCNPMDECAGGKVCKCMTGTRTLLRHLQFGSSQVCYCVDPTPEMSIDGQWVNGVWTVGEGESHMDKLNELE